MIEKNSRIDKASIHTKIVAIGTLFTLALIVEDIIMGWDLWMVPPLIIMVVLMWIFHIFQPISEQSRETYYILLAIIDAFYHGMHDTSLFDVALISAVLILIFSLLDNPIVLDLCFLNYLFIMVMQLTIISGPKAMFGTPLLLSRTVLHVAIVISTYLICRSKAMSSRELLNEIIKRDERIKKSDIDNEDFLSTISHELRTPVNVVNGMSSLIIKKEDREDVKAILEAGMRLAGQIEDIQDYTEIRRGQIVLEEDRYSVTSLLNDLIENLRANAMGRGLEFIVEQDPDVPSLLKGDIRKIRKILRHIVFNAVKFTKKGGVYISVRCLRREYGVNLLIEVTDTGVGMTEKEVAAVSRGIYQGNNEKNKSTGGIGLGLSVVFGFAHRMNGFVKIESKKKKGTTVRVSIPQEVLDPSPCLSLEPGYVRTGLFHVKPGKFDEPRIQEFYRTFAVNTAAGIGVNLYSAVTLNEIKRALEERQVTHIFMGEEEYLEAADFFDELAKGDVKVAVSSSPGFHPNRGSRIILLPQPLYSVPVIKVLNGVGSDMDISDDVSKEIPDLTGIKALIVDDEPMNIVVASGLFRNYHMETEAAESGKESLEKFTDNDYDIIFMDHMMPEMDGVEAMKRLRLIAEEKGRHTYIVALTANAVSGAREMFMREGFDGFISKPIDIDDFERVMKKLFPHSVRSREGGES